MHGKGIYEIPQKRPKLHMNPLIILVANILRRYSFVHFGKVFFSSDFLICHTEKDSLSGAVYFHAINTTLQVVYFILSQRTPNFVYMHTIYDYTYGQGTKNCTSSNLLYNNETTLENILFFLQILLILVVMKMIFPSYLKSFCKARNYNAI